RQGARGTLAAARFVHGSVRRIESGAGESGARAPRSDDGAGAAAARGRERQDARSHEGSPRFCPRLISRSRSKTDRLGTQEARRIASWVPAFLSGGVFSRYGCSFFSSKRLSPCRSSSVKLSCAGDLGGPCWGLTSMTFGASGRVSLRVARISVAGSTSG